MNSEIGSGRRCPMLAPRYRCIAGACVLGRVRLASRMPVNPWRIGGAASVDHSIVADVGHLLADTLHVQRNRCSSTKLPDEEPCDTSGEHIEIKTAVRRVLLCVGELVADQLGWPDLRRTNDVNGAGERS
jgi:hypothetical protein